MLEFELEPEATVDPAVMQWVLSLPLLRVTALDRACMPDLSPQTVRLAPGPVPASKRPSFLQVGESFLVHGLILAFLILGPSLLGGSHPTSRGAMQAVIMISAARQPAQAQQQAAAEKRLAEQPAIRKPQPVIKPEPVAPAKPQLQKSAATVGHEGKLDKPDPHPDPQPDPDAEFAALMRGVRGNWLAPPNVARDFHCRVKISYQPGGLVSAVELQGGCGSALLDDSVERAIWKTQPLPIPGSLNQAGSIIIEFSPR